jgi:hypothetical protein
MLNCCVDLEEVRFFFAGTIYQIFVSHVETLLPLYTLHLSSRRRVVVVLLSSHRVLDFSLNIKTTPKTLVFSALVRGGVCACGR